MALKRKIIGSLVGFVGFMLSPLSWWNDLFVNVPLALGFAWLVSYFYPPMFKPAVVVGYWLTNVIGFWMMHKGAQQMLQEKAVPYSRKNLLQDFAIAGAYTVLLLLLLKFDILQPIKL